MNWTELLVGAGTSGVLVQVLNHVRQTRKDAASARGEELQRSDALTMQMWVEITKEQRDWRDTLRKQIDEQSLIISEVRLENAELLRRVAELEGRNADLQEENDQLEARVKELERELREKAT